MQESAPYNAIMSLAAESPSPSHSSSSRGDLATLLPAELSAISDAEEDDFEEPSGKRLKTEGSGDVHEATVVEEIREDTGTSISEVNNGICPPHPGFIKGMCIRCGHQQEDDGSAIAFGYIHKVWSKHKDNLILMERYHYFASSCRQFNFNAKSLSESMKDERESDGALATILNILKRAHQMFFDPDLDTDISSRDVRQVLKKIRSDVLRGCKVAFSHLYRREDVPEVQPIWKMAERLGATCSREVDSSVTHVVSKDAGTQKAHWAVDNKKFLVSPGWIEAANYLWGRQREEDFPVTSSKSER